jgi:probable rRNA maturation factor
MSELVLRNRQRAHRVNTPLLHQITRSLLAGFAAAEEYELCIHLVAAPEMAQLNKTFLQHSSSTDVITFDYADNVGQASRLPNPRLQRNIDRRDACPTLRGEIFICMDDAISQARQFRTTWQSEIVRYIVHGVLHLLGHDDRKAVARRKMKREENRLLRRLVNQFPIARLAR